MTTNRSYGALLSLLCIVSSACNFPPPQPRKTQLEVRQFQTRVYPDKETKQVMKGVINALQDDGFIIRNADKELGFVTATKEVEVSGFGGSFVLGVLGEREPRYDRAATFEASVNVSEFGRETKVRVVFQRRVVDNYGAPSATNQIEDPLFYQQFFSKVDKSLFIEREGL